MQGKTRKATQAPKIKSALRDNLKKRKAQAKKLAKPTDEQALEVRLREKGMSKPE